MTEFELIETWYLAAQIGANTFVSSSTVIFAYILVAHFAGKSLEPKIAAALTALYSLFLVGSIGARFGPMFTSIRIAAEYSERFPDGNGLDGGTSILPHLIFGQLPFILAWVASIYYLHFHVRKRENNS